ncbi:hypothetical protein Mapa_003000 [Marchantia paleacea]|nr:hypothetical protein Mapa_003000 [Marchantia paleacea]
MSARMVLHSVWDSTRDGSCCWASRGTEQPHGGEGGAAGAGAAPRLPKCSIVENELNWRMQIDGNVVTVYLEKL